MTFSDLYVETNGLHGRTLQYEYDGEQRITKVTDSVEGVTEYTYDMLGQLICEKRNGVVTDITYDEYGNILTKGGKTYAYGETNVDLLTSYDGTAISYGTGVNKSLNPIVYRGMNLTWTKGRQLASVSSNGKTVTFSYNPRESEPARRSMEQSMIMCWKERS